MKIFSDLTYETDSLIPEIHISSISDVQNLIDSLISSTPTYDTIKSKAIQMLELLKTEENEKMVVFLIEQIRNIGIASNNRRYSFEFLLICIKMAVFSPKLYRTLRKFNILILPHQDNIRKYLSGINVSVDNQDENSSYIKHKISRLRGIEKEFILMIDEIHIKAKAEFHLEYGFHGVDEKDRRLARTVVGFMVKSIFGNYKEVIYLMPKFQTVSFDLSSKCMKVINLIEKFGAKVVAIATDNNRININMYSGLFFKDLNPSKEHHFFPSRRVFRFYDPVHIIKNLRNNFIKKKDVEQTIQFYKVDDQGEKILCFAKFKHLYDLYKESETQPLKISSAVTLKSLVPTPMERQKVSLALKIFNHQNVVGLKYLAEKKSDDSYLDTAFLVEKFTLWFELFNTKTTDKGVNRHNPLLNPISSIDNPTLQFYREYLDWLDIQKPLKAKFLTKQTFEAMIVSTRALIEVCHYLIGQGYYGILSGVFQSDPIEKRFGLYRSLNGGNFHIGDKAAKLSEKKIRISSLLDMSCNLSELKNAISLLKKPDIIETGVSNVTISRYSSIFLPWEASQVTTTDQGVLYYIVGFCVRKALSKIQCPSCREVFKQDTIHAGFSSLIKLFENEHLTYPTFRIMQKVMTLDFILYSLTLGKQKEKFFDQQNKFSLIIGLLETQTDIDFECELDHSLKPIFKNIFHSFINIFLGKLASFKNDYLSGENLRKLRIFDVPLEESDDELPVDPVTSP